MTLADKFQIIGMAAWNAWNLDNHPELYEPEDEPEIRKTLESACRLMEKEFDGDMASYAAEQLKKGMDKNDIVDAFTAGVVQTLRRTVGGGTFRKTSPEPGNN